MIAKDIGIVQNKALAFEESNPANNKGFNPGAGKAFQEIITELLGSEGINAKNNNGSDQKKSYTSLRSKLAEVSKSDAIDAAKMQKKIEAAIQWLAGYLGIKPSFLLAVFSELGIDPMEMADPMKFQEILHKLAERLNLNGDQMKEISEKMGAILGFTC